MKAREDRIRHLGGLTLEMYRRSSFRDQLLIEQCREIVALEDRLRELDSMLESVATARRAPSTCECGAPVRGGFCAHCGRPVETSDEAEPEPEAQAAEPAVDETILRSADPWER